MDHLAYTSDGKTGQGPEFQVGRYCYLHLDFYE